MSAISSFDEMLTRDEGESSTVYKDSLGRWTISRGICVDPLVIGAGLRPEESRWIALNRQQLILDHCHLAFPWFPALSLPRQAVIAAMAYQLGFNGLAKFHDTLDAVSKGIWDRAATCMRNSLWAKQVPERAERMAKQMETGVWQ